MSDLKTSAKRGKVGLFRLRLANHAFGFGVRNAHNGQRHPVKGAHEVPLVQLLTADAAMRDRGFVSAQGIGYNLQQ